MSTTIERKPLEGTGGREEERYIYRGTMRAGVWHEANKEPFGKIESRTTPAQVHESGHGLDRLIDHLLRDRED